MPTVERHLADRPRGCGKGVVKQDVHAAEAIKRKFDHPFDLAGNANVRMAEHRCRTDLAGDTIAASVINIRDDDPSAFDGEQFCSRLADSGAPASYDSNFVVEFAHFFHRPIFMRTSRTRLLGFASLRLVACAAGPMSLLAVLS